MKKRLVSKKEIQKAYTREVNHYEDDIKDKKENNLEKLPTEVFQILGKVISFVEMREKIEGDKNENKS